MTLFDEYLKLKSRDAKPVPFRWSMHGPLPAESSGPTPSLTDVFEYLCVIKASPGAVYLKLGPRQLQELRGEAERLGNPVTDKMMLWGFDVAYDEHYDNLTVEDK